MADYIGQIKMTSFSVEPAGWFFCDGRTLNIGSFKQLYQVLGASFGGDGKTTFALPDFRGKTIVHPSNTIQLYADGGAPNKTLAAANIPPHTHTVKGKIKCQSAAGTNNNPVNRYPAFTGALDKEYHTDAEAGKYMASDSVKIESVSSAGVPSPAFGTLDNMQPYIAVNFIIAWKH